MRTLPKLGATLSLLFLLGLLQACSTTRDCHVLCPKRTTVIISADNGATPTTFSGTIASHGTLFPFECTSQARSGTLYSCSQTGLVASESFSDPVSGTLLVDGQEVAATYTSESRAPQSDCGCWDYSIRVTYSE